MKNVTLITTLCFSLVGCSFSKTRQAGFDIITMPAGRGSSSVEVGDFNRDGMPDIAVANIDDSSITILLNLGNRKFKPANGSPFFAGHFPNDIDIADFNKDGNLDLAIANHEKKYFTILLGNGKGHFEPAANSPFPVCVKPHTHGIISADFNSDGNLDVATDSWSVDSIVTLNGDGKADFRNPVYFATGKHPYQRLRTADFNNDGKADIVTTNLESNDISILLGDGKGRFTEHLFAAGSAPFAIGTGDFNMDKNTDLAIANCPSLANVGFGKDGLTVLLNDGRGNFTPIQGSPFTTGSGPSRVASGDLNNDGFDDIVIADYKSYDFLIYYMCKSGLQSTSRQKIGNFSDGLAVYDMDADGKKDILVTSSTDNNVSVFFAK